MDGHIHSGFAHAVHFAITLVIVLTVLRLATLLLVASDIPLLQKAGGGMAWILN